MSKPVLFLHIGIPKTGSTALQIYFVNHAKQMLDHGLYYPDTDGTFSRCQELGLTSGNGYPLALICQQYAENVDQLRIHIHQWIAELAERDATSFKAILLSCETLSTLNRMQWEVLQAVLEKYFDIRVISFYREPYAWLFSSWLQVVKSDGAQGWLGAGNPNTDWLPLILPKTLTEKLLENIIELCYEECKNDIVSAFFNAIGFSTPLFNPKKKNIRNINTSLTAQELTLLLLINRLTKGDPAFGQSFAVKAIGMTTSAPCYFYSPSVDKMLDDFLDASGVTRRLQCENQKPVVISEEAWFKTQTVNGIALASIFAALTDYYDKRLNNPVNRALAAANYYTNSFFRSQVPDGFDVMAYLLINRDVLGADIDPYRHYLNFGCKEGRQFIWGLQPHNDSGGSLIDSAENAESPANL